MEQKELPSSAVYTQGLSYALGDESLLVISPFMNLISKDRRIYT